MTITGYRDRVGSHTRRTGPTGRFASATPSKRNSDAPNLTASGGADTAEMSIKGVPGSDQDREARVVGDRRRSSSEDSEIIRLGSEQLTP